MKDSRQTMIHVQKWRNFGDKMAPPLLPRPDICTWFLNSLCIPHTVFYKKHLL